MKIIKNIFSSKLSILNASELMDDDWYRLTYPDVAASGISSARHYLDHGAAEGRNPSAYFDTKFYLDQYLDVAQSGMNPLLHYILYGKAEGRSTSSGSLDTEFYIQLYLNGNATAEEAISHYSRQGKSCFYYEKFDKDWYLEEYPELRYYDGDLRNHFLNHGQFEGRVPHFDSEWYKAEYPEVVLQPLNPREHYLSVGRSKGNNPAFDRNFYLRSNPDIFLAGIEPFEHYHRFGRYEGRAPGFNRYWYQQFYDDVDYLNTDPHAHYFTEGQQEGRQLSFTNTMDINKWGSQARYGADGSHVTRSWAVPSQSRNYNPKVTVIVPNYNHAKYLPERLESIYNQTYTNFEVLLLDDASTDNSVEVLREYAARYPEVTTCAFNKQNSGGVFHQWKRGFELAQGELVWIAESDDYCDRHFLSELVRFFQNKTVMLAFSRTDFVDGSNGKCIWTSEAYWEEVGLEGYKEPVIVPGHQIVKIGWGVRNLAPNVSSVLFRHPGQLAIFDDPEWQRLRMCGDWILYLSMIRGGAVAYTPTVTNYYRQHPTNTSISTHDTNLYYQEHEVVALYLAKNFAVSEDILKFNEEVLYKHWCMKRGTDKRQSFEENFHYEKVNALTTNRKRNVAIAIFAFVPGGGEAFPILLANLLLEHGHSVTLVNFNCEPTNPEILANLNPAIPVLEPKRSIDAGKLLNDLGVEIVHSHHGWVDISLAYSLMSEPNIAQVVTTHGFYEIMDPADVKRYENVLNRVDQFAYIADKNLNPFSQDFVNTNGFTKVTNTISINSLEHISRAELGLSEKDFVVCLASRGVANKGWEEAIAATAIANKTSVRSIHLLLVGDGPEYERLKGIGYDNVSFLGFKKNVRSYFALSDLGLIASKFKGESCPLVLIECLSVGKPVLTTNIGEVKNMLESATGMAGVTIELHNWEIDVSELAKQLATLSSDADLYETIAAGTNSAFSKFSQEIVIGDYLNIYEKAISTRIEKENELELSVIVISYNMSRELPNTLYTLSAGYQNIELSKYEVIVIDNGSSCKYDYKEMRDICPNVHFYRSPETSVSPVSAINHGLKLARGKVICVFIDGARMASPRLLQNGLTACNNHDRAVVGSLSFHLGKQSQNTSVLSGYNQSVEDRLLETVDWKSNGYELFKISSFDPSSRFGLHNIPAETNSLFLSRQLWSEIGGFDLEFKGRGGGLVNLDIWRRLCEDSRNVVVTLTGEGTFHQFHGGVATNAINDVWAELHSEYLGIRGVNYELPSRRPFHFGKPHEWLFAFEAEQSSKA